MLLLSGRSSPTTSRAQPQSGEGCLAVDDTCCPSARTPTERQSLSQCPGDALVAIEKSTTQHVHLQIRCGTSGRCPSQNPGLQRPGNANSAARVQICILLCCQLAVPRTPLVTQHARSCVCWYTAFKHWSGAAVDEWEPCARLWTAGVLGQLHAACLGALPLLVLNFTQCKIGQLLCCVFTEAGAGILPDSVAAHPDAASGSAQCHRCIRA